MTYCMVRIMFSCQAQKEKLLNLDSLFISDSAEVCEELMGYGPRGIFIFLKFWTVATQPFPNWTNCSGLNFSHTDVFTLSSFFK